MSLVGSMVGRIRVDALLGRGGMGELYAGHDLTLDRPVALKAILPDRRLQPEVKARFLREARALSQLDHPNICRIHDYVEHEGGDFLVLELIEGRNLQAAIREGLGGDEKLRIAEQIAGALEAAHAEGVVHRDLKPGNVMLTREGQVKVLDFGLARITRPRQRSEAPPRPAGPELPATAFAGPGPGPPARGAAVPGAEDGPPTSVFVVPPDAPAAPPGEGASGAAAAEPAEEPDVGDPGEARAGEAGPRTRRGTIVGTPGYMSPEQARGEAGTTAGDMYSFGLLLQALFTGRPPYPAGAGTAELVERALRAETLPVTGLPKDLGALVRRLVAPAPAARPTAVDATERLRWIRQAPRRRGRRLAAAAVVLIALLGAAKYTLDLRRERALAVAAREEADRRRDQAEDLIQFMLGDLRGRLEPVGRLDALDGVAAKALDYFASIPEDELTDADLFRRSRALMQLGEVRVAQGDLPAARRSLDEAHALARGVVRRRPGNGELLMGLGAIEFWRGNVHWLQGDLEGAEERFRSYLAVAESLVALDPAHPEWRMELAYAHSNLGTLEQARGDVAGALAHFRRTVEVKQALVASSPDDPRLRRELADSLSWLAEARLTGGDLGAAQEEYEAGRALLQRLVAGDPGDTRDRYLLAIAHNKVGTVLEMRVDDGRARRQFELSLALLRDLAELDPANADWRREVAIAHQRLGRGLAWGDPEAGLPHLRRAAATLAELLAADASNTERRLDLARCRVDLGRALVDAGRAEPALAELARASEVLGPGHPAGEEGRRQGIVEGEARLVQGRALARAGRRSEAEAAWQAAAGILGPLAGGSADPRVLGPLTEALTRLGRSREARPLAARLTAGGYRIRELVDADGKHPVRD